jgi:hypothetical protein
MMTNIDLEKRAKEIAIPLVGVYSKDLLPSYAKDGGYIINLQDSTDEDGLPLPGTHWTAFYIEKNRAVYFDSFGVIAPRSVQTFLRRFKPWMFSTKHIQNVQSEICGYYVLYFLWFMWTHRHRIKNLNKRFCAFLCLFSTSPERNKTLLEKYIKPL